MGLFGRSEPQRIVVREYGRDSFLGLINPVMTMMFMLGRRSPSNYQARVVASLERDAAEMVRRGYRVASTHDYEQPALGITYFKVTYELIDPPR
jgi:hypothetical protein